MNNTNLGQSDAILSNNLLILREQQGYSAKQVAGFLGCSVSAYTNYENRKKAVPYNTLIAATKLYSVTADNLLTQTMPK